MRTRPVLSFVVLQLGWFASVLGAAHGHPWLGPVVVLGSLAVHVRLQPATARTQEVLVLALAAAIGLLVDAALFRAHVTAVGDARIPPAWLVVLWPNVAAATAPTGSLHALARRPLLGALAGAVAGPLAYDAGYRLGAIELDRARLFVIALAWSGVLPIFFALRSRIAATALPNVDESVKGTTGEP
jgi:hypothetical protein